jgi:hypothetical protein
MKSLGYSLLLLLLGMLGCGKSQPSPPNSVASPADNQAAASLKEANLQTGLLMRTLFDNLQQHAQETCDEAKREGTYKGKIRQDCIDLLREIKTERETWEKAHQ